MKNFNMDKSIDLLDFVQDCQKLFSTQNDIVTNDTNWKSYQDNLATRKELLVQIFQKYFHEESPSTIPLSNSVLRDDIYQKLKSITRHDQFEVSEDTMTNVVELLKVSSRDYRVWKGGLEVTYKAFLASKPTCRISSQINACLLSIM